MRINRMGKAAFSFYKWLGFIVALIVSVISAVLGFIDNTPSQLVMLYTVAIFGSILWGWHHLSVRWTYIDGLDEEDLQLVENIEIQDKHIRVFAKFTGQKQYAGLLEYTGS